MSASANPPPVYAFLLVDAREHDEAVHEQQAEAATTNKNDEYPDPYLPARPRVVQKVSQPTLAQDVFPRTASP